MMRVSDIESIAIKLASPDEILSWSHGEVTKPETINYRTQRAEKDGLFCEKIFGPEKDYECYCGKYKRVRYKGVVCDKCGVEVTKSQVRRERMGHIKLAAPCSHIWFLRGVPSRMGLVLDIPMQHLERVIYFASYIVIKANDEMRKKTIEDIEKEYKQKIKNKKSNIKDAKELKKSLDALKAARNKAREEVLSIKPQRVLSELEYHNFSLKYGELFEAGTGAETLRKIFAETDWQKKAKELEQEIKNATPVSQRKILRRLRLIKSILKAKIGPEWMFLDVLPVLPPDLRPMVQLDGGRYASSDLNDLYRRVINRNNRLKYLLEIDAPEVIVRNEKRMLQEAVDALIDNGMRKGQTTTATTGGKRLLKSLADMLKGKQGRFRQNLLGKRVDYSGRSVIVVGPELKINQCGLPKAMALELFKPFVIQKILEKELAYNVRSASKLIEAQTEEVWAILEDVVKDKLVLLNRAPTLHRLGVQAFYPILIEGLAIRVHPMICKAFNADFDGDQMAVHLPLSREAQKEAKEIMLTSINLLKPASGAPIVSPTQDIVLGCYWVTAIKENAKGEGKIFGSKNEAILAYQTDIIDLRAKIKLRMKNEILETSVGRIFFNNALPEGHQFINRELNSKGLEELVGDLIDKHDNETVAQTIDKIKEVGFEYCTISGITWGMDDLVVPKEKPKLIEEASKKIELIDSYYKKGLLSREEKASQTIEVWQKTKSEIEKLVPKTLDPLNPVFVIISSGARGSWSQPVQMTGMKGLVINPAGQIIELPVKSSFKEGFSVLEYFISTHGARKGTADTALRTSTAGYLTRRLVDVAHEVITYEEDCGDRLGIAVLAKDSKDIGQNFIFKISGRVAAEDVKGKSKTIVKAGGIIDLKLAKEIIESGVEEVKIRSPLSCKTARGVCQKCYGLDLGNNRLVGLGETVGIVAAQAIGEPGTQLTMRTFHTGGVAGGGDITQGLPRVEEIFESRIPGGKAAISAVDGSVEDITEERVIKVAADNDQKEKSKKKEVVEYGIPPKRAIWVNKGDKVIKGQQLCEGNVDLKELFRLVGPAKTQYYIVSSIQ
ncbi:MAG: DNA-directed RNA polymerase subunit beta' [Candidatus Nealsonbacteria bacterium]|nr:DNA-directed RNA polymerase subunit beta' [Candidatus Nealsonbacteria bacterium]